MRIAYTIFILAITFSTSSCYKVWTCECELKNPNPNPNSSERLGGADFTAPSFKKKAKAECDDLKTTLSANLASGESIECTLK